MEVEVIKVKVIGAGVVVEVAVVMEVAVVVEIMKVEVEIAVPNRLEHSKQLLFMT